MADTVAALGVHVEHIAASVASLTEAIRDLEEKVVGRREYEGEISRLKDRISAMEKALEESRKMQTERLLRWVVPVVLAVIVWALPRVIERLV